MLYIIYIVGVQDQLLGKSLVIIENSVHFKSQMHRYPFILCEITLIINLWLYSLLKQNEFDNFAVVT